VCLESGGEHDPAMPCPPGGRADGRGHGYRSADRPGWVFEPKFDGFRALGFCDPTRVMLQSRQQRPLTYAFPDVAATLSPFAHDEVVLDGVI
jgi:ATP-dependent DNA ligase